MCYNNILQKKRKEKERKSNSSISSKKKLPDYTYSHAIFLHILKNETDKKMKKNRKKIEIKFFLEVLNDDIH